MAGMAQIKWRIETFGIIGFLGQLLRRLIKGHWTIWTELMYQNTGTTADAETAMTDFVPGRDGRLKAVKICPAAVAATTLIESGYVKLTCKLFGGVDLQIPFSSSGLATVPKAVDSKIYETMVDVPVKAGVPIKGYYYYNVTPTTPELLVYGVFVG